MRERLRPLRDRTMARRPGDGGRFSLSPRARRIAGWVAAIAVIGVIAIGVGLLGDSGGNDGAAASRGASPSASLAAIAFGTALDPATGEVAADARTERFAAGDTFAYSVPAESLPPEIYVGVERLSDAEPAVVQDPATQGMQRVTDQGGPIAFTVPVADLLEVFGPGRYRMRIHLQPQASAIAEGTFELVGQSPSGSAGASPSAGASARPSESP